MSKPVSSIDVRDILTIIRRRKWLIIIPLPLVAAIAFAGSYLIAPEYESSTIIQIAPQIQLIGELQRLIGQPTGVRSMRSSERTDLLRSTFNEITSSHYAELLNARMNLVHQPEIEKQARLYVQLQPSMTLEQARLQVLQEQLKRMVQVSWASGDQIQIIVNSTDATQARDIANHLGDIFIAEKIRHDLNRIRSSQDFSDVQLEKYERQVLDKQADVTGVEQQLARLRNSDATSSEANRSEITAEIDQTETEIDDLRRDERAILSRLSGVAGLNINELNLGNSEARRIAQRELENRLRQIGDLLSKYTWSDPRVISFKVRQNDLLTTIDSENKTLVREQYADFDASTRQDLVSLFSTRSRLDYLYSKKPYLQSALDDLTPSTDLIPEYEAQLTRYQRELQVAIDIRDRFRRQQESSTLSQALVEDPSSNYRKVEPAKLALGPHKPDRRRIFLMGILLGLVIGGAAVLLVELMDNSFKKVENVEEALGLPVIGISPKVDFIKRLMR